MKDSKWISEFKLSIFCCFLLVQFSSVLDLDAMMLFLCLSLSTFFLFSIQSSPTIHFIQPNESIPFHTKHKHRWFPRNFTYVVRVLSNRYQAAQHNLRLLDWETEKVWLGLQSRSIKILFIAIGKTEKFIWKEEQFMMKRS